MTGVSVGARPAENPDELALIADDWTSLNKPVADRFRQACSADGFEHDGWVDPNRVRVPFVVDGELTVDPRQYSALWSKASARDGYLFVTDVKVPISGPGSRGNGNKDIRLRYWIDGRPQAARSCWCGAPAEVRPDTGFVDCIGNFTHDWRGTSEPDV